MGCNPNKRQRDAQWPHLSVFLVLNDATAGDDAHAVDTAEEILLTMFCIRAEEHGWTERFAVFKCVYTHMCVFVCVILFDQ